MTVCPRPLLLDGGLATELEAAGHRLDDRLWSGRLLLDDPDSIATAHRAYVSAGADVLLTATYQLADEPLRVRGLDDAAIGGIYDRAIGLAAAARSSVERRVRVAGSIGSFGASLPGGEEYRGRYLRAGAQAVTDRELADFHLRRLTALLADARVDVIALETFPGAREVEVVLDLVERLGAGDRDLWVSLSCSDAERTGAGEALIEVARRLGDRVEGLGVNCSDPRWGGRHLEALAEGRGSAARAGLLIYPNAGERYESTRTERGGWEGTRLEPEPFVAQAQDWIAHGLLAVGGCCRTTPNHISALRRLLDQSRPT